jgi:hypothetical protein
MGIKDSASGLPGIDGDYRHPAATVTQPQALKARSRLVSPLIEQELRRPRGLGRQSRGLEGTVHAKLLWSLANPESEADLRTPFLAMPGHFGHKTAATHTSNPNMAGGAGLFHEVSSEWASERRR